MDFVFGIIFAISILPLLDNITVLIATFMEMIKSYFAVIIAANNDKINSASIPQTHAIGFEIPEEYDEEEVCEDDDL